jgi:hypothetical protein
LEEIAAVPPSAEEQVRFLVKVQRLLEEGQFVASYKFALLLALADLSIEVGDDSGGRLPITTDQIAEKFIKYYWRQAVPYPTSEQYSILRQNTGSQAEVLKLLMDARRAHGDSFPAVMRLPFGPKLVRRVAAIVRKMPLWKLQTFGRQNDDFLYENVGSGGAIALRSGVAFTFRKFHGLISDLVRGAWIRYVRQQNLTILGETADLNEFLFGSERANLAAVEPILRDLQRGACFYCGSALKASNAQVDHFIAWSRYPVDLGHNFVLADSTCNNRKRDRLPSYNHLAAWMERNSQHGQYLGGLLEERGIISQLAASNCVARWAYSQTEAAGGLTWTHSNEMVPLDASWRVLLEPDQSGRPADLDTVRIVPGGRSLPGGLSRRPRKPTAPEVDRGNIFRRED